MTTVRQFWEWVRNTPGLKFDLVAVVLLAVLGVGAAVYFMANYSWTPPWEEQITYSAELQKAPGVDVDALQEVRVAGVKVGKVSDAAPEKNGLARITLSLDPGVKVYDNAHLVWRSKAPVNVMYVALNPGGPPGKPLPPGGTLPVSQTERAIQPAELLDKLDDRSRTALSALLDQSDVALANAPADLPRGLNATNGTMTAFRPVVQQLQQRRDLIRRLVTSLAEVSTAAGGDQQRLARMTASLQSTLGVLGNRDDDLRATLGQLPGFTGQLNHAMRGATRLTGQLNPTLDALRGASDKLPPALSRLTETVRNAGPVLRQANPVLRHARPVVADLRPLVPQVSSALGNLSPVTGDLPLATKKLVPWLPSLGGFVYQTSSAFSLGDVNGGMGRANVVLNVTNPLGGGDGSAPPVADDTQPGAEDLGHTNASKTGGH